jgi:hypothetical protein
MKLTRDQVEVKYRGGFYPRFISVSVTVGPFYLVGARQVKSALAKP